MHPKNRQHRRDFPTISSLSSSRVKTSNHISARVDLAAVFRAYGAGGGLHICTTSLQIPYHTQVRGLPGESLDLPPRWTFLPTSS